MTRVEKTVLVLHSAQDMWALVNDIPSYPQFLPWCSATEVHESDGLNTVATIHINFHGLRQHFTTRNHSVPGESMVMELLDGPFRHLRGEFRFIALKPEACKITFSLEWTFANRLLEKVVGPVFHTIANSMVDAFVARAGASHRPDAP